MKDYIDKLKEIETLVELSIGKELTEEKATDIYAITNDLMCRIKKSGRFYSDKEIENIKNDSFSEGYVQHQRDYIGE